MLRLALGLSWAKAAAGIADLGDASALLQSAVFDSARLDVEAAERPSLSTMSGYIHDPEPASLEEMRRIEPKAQGMVLYNFTNDIFIYGYDKLVDQSISQTLSKGRMWEAGNVGGFCSLFESLAQRGDFLDVGANIGTWSIPIAHCIRKMGFGGKVIAVEGLKPIAEHLEASVLKNNMTDMIDVFNYAVGDGYTTVDGKKTETPDEVTMREDATNKGASSMVKSRQGWIEKTTPLTTLDAILGSRNYKIVAMKMDIEGYEGRALTGASEFLKRPPCMLSIELNRGWLETAGTPVEGVVDVLTRAGYELPPTEDIKGLFNTVLYQKNMEECMKRFGGTWPLPMAEIRRKNAERRKERDMLAQTGKPKQQPAAKRSAPVQRAKQPAAKVAAHRVKQPAAKRAAPAQRAKQPAAKGAAQHVKQPAAQTAAAAHRVKQPAAKRAAPAQRAKQPAAKVAAHRVKQPAAKRAAPAQRVKQLAEKRAAVERMKQAVVK